jgi:hypothetical protein
MDNESLIPRARNKLAHLFMESDATHLLFWDADLGVDVSDLREMLAYGEMKEHAVVGAIYPKKVVNWENVRRVLGSGVVVSDHQLAAAAGNYVVNMPPESKGMVKGESGKPIEVMEVGTGLMLVQRGVFEAIQQRFSELWYKAIDGDVPSSSTKPTDKLWSYFESGVMMDAYGVGTGPAYVSEDFAFCHRWRDCGGKVWMAPWVRSTHRGSFDFVGDFEAMARVKGEIARLQAATPPQTTRQLRTTAPPSDPSAE